MAPHILIIEDQRDINDLIAMNLKALNFSVTQVFDGINGLEEALNGQFDAIVLDIMLPGMDGLQLCQHLRSKGAVTPVLMLTAKKNEAERVIGLEVGADDYLTKPFSVLELQARLKALLRRVAFHSKQEDEEDASSKIICGNLVIDQNTHRVLIDQKPIHVTGKEFDLLVYMASYPGRVFSREQLLNAVWGYHHESFEHTVNSHINRLRSKLEKDPSNPEYVLTVWGVGYQFCDMAGS